MRISFRSRGDWDETDRWLKNMQHISIDDILNAYGDIGVEALKNATPVDTGKTRDSWYYKIQHPQEGVSRIDFCNSNIVKGVPIAIIIQYGHGTNNGGFVQGRDYINPVVQPIFDSLADDAYKEVTRS